MEAVVEQEVEQVAEQTVEENVENAVEEAQEGFWKSMLRDKVLPGRCFFICLRSFALLVSLIFVFSVHLFACLLV